MTLRPDLNDQMIGRQIARYRIVEQLGSGGMSVVYKGIDTSLDREVAVKVLHPHLAAKEESRQRFSREARAVAKLRHPNILEIYDFSGDEASEAFIVTEYIRGMTLRSFAEKNSFHPPEIAAMALHELASALDHAHKAGIIHRDLKPDNVMIREDGILKLMDFGIAKVIDRDERMTMTGALVGSPAHMAPEIIEGQEASRESDIFSLGTILYWLCCKKLPFFGNNTTQTLRLILEAKYTDPRLFAPAVCDDLAEIMAKCLARDPSARFGSAAELRDALADLLTKNEIEGIGDELPLFFANPSEYKKTFQQALIARFNADAERYSRGPEQNFALTLDRLNRILALDPKNRAATEMLALTRNRRIRKRRIAIVGAVTAAGALAIGAALTLSNYDDLRRAILDAPDASLVDSDALAETGRYAQPHDALRPQIGQPDASSSNLAPSQAPLILSSLPSANNGTGDDPSQDPAATTTEALLDAGRKDAADIEEGVSPAGTVASELLDAGTELEIDAGTESVDGEQAAPREDAADSGTQPQEKIADKKSKDKVVAKAAINETDGLKRSANGAHNNEENRDKKQASAAAATREISIKVRPQQYARIFLDGILVNPNTPTFQGPFAVGKHKMRVDSDYSWPREQDLEVLPAQEGAAQQQFVIDLEKKPALLVVRSSNKDLRLLVNNTPSPSTSGESEKDPIPVPLPDGSLRTKATVRAFHPGFRDQEHEVEFTAGKRSELTIELEKQ